MYKSCNSEYYLNLLYLYAYSVCVCLYVSVISEISGTGGRNATLLAPTWRASLGELQQLLLKLTRRMVRGEKLLEVFRS